MSQQNDIAIRVQNLSKAYKLYNKPVDRMKESLHPFRKRYHHDFYALNDVSFEVKKGETVGIIGKNGSGKSTLLKLITGVLTPTSGSVQVNGKVSALIELGAGFNPEFTGLENVYFSGSIMGYTKAEIDAKVDDILSFADIGEFVYQPVKTYSSGMFARLAFAVSINVDPDILIVDEALAVGDAKFVKKCYKTMDEIRNNGKTILLVTHDTNMIKSFTSKGILIDDGCKIYDGDPVESVMRYMRMLFPDEFQTEIKRDTQDETKNDKLNFNISEYIYSVSAINNEKYWGMGGGVVTRVDIYGLTKPNSFKGGELLRVDVSVKWDIEFISQKVFENNCYPNVIVGLILQNKQNISVLGINTYEKKVKINPEEQNCCVVSFKFTVPELASGEYFISPAIAIGTQENHIILQWSEIAVEIVCLNEKKYEFGIVHINSEVEVL